MWKFWTVAAAAGGLLRYGIWVMAMHLFWHNGAFIAACVANGSGCLLFGAALGFKDVLPTSWFRIWTVGFCGSLTTFGDWLESSLRLLSEHGVWAFVGALFFSFLLGCALLWAGRVGVGKLRSAVMRQNRA
jgi:fluoride ion exporter CrcB/FEX